MATQRIGNEPDENDMSTEFDPNAEVSPSPTTDVPGEEDEAAKLGDFA